MEARRAPEGRKEVVVDKVFERMVEEMQIRGFSPNTQKAYLHCAKAFAQHFTQPPDELTLEDVRDYQLHMIRRGISGQYLNQIVSAVRFLYNKTLRLNWDVEQLPYRKCGRDLPVPLSREEVQALFAATRNLKHITILKTLYGGGPRVAELVHLRVADIDSQRMLIRIKDGKGEKDRFVMLPRDLLPMLRRYWLAYRPDRDSWLFPGQVDGRPLTVRAVEKMVRRTAQKAGITKDVTPHILRHTFATHLMEDGVSLLEVQELLGHRSLGTTARYMHLIRPRQVKSPLDTLDGGAQAQR